MQKAYFEINNVFYSGYTNGSWLFATPSNQQDYKAKKIDINKIPLDLLLNTQNLMELPYIFGITPLKDMVDVIRCKTCNGDGYFICPSCSGRGLKFCDCHCGHSHQSKCLDCNGHGKIACKACNLVQSLQYSLQYIQIDDIVVNESLLLQLLSKLPWHEPIYALIQSNVLLIKTGLYLAALMAVDNTANDQYGIEDIKYEIKLAKPTFCVYSKSHCWHLSAQVEICCWCGVQRQARPHGKYYPGNINQEEPDVF